MGENLKQYYVCSLCYKGILGGGLILEADSVTYTTGKVTVDKKYRNLKLEFKDVENVSWKTVIFPVATFLMKNGESYKFIIFNKARFIKYCKLFKK